MTHEPEDHMEKRRRRRVTSKRALVTGLAALLPLALSIFLIVWVCGLINEHIARPVNNAIKGSLVAGARTANGRAFLKKWFAISDEALAEVLKDRTKLRRELDAKFNPIVGLAVGFLVALGTLYVVGFLLATYIGRKAFRMTERVLAGLPGLRIIYPYARQVTHFFLGPRDGSASRFSRAVAVEYPRREMWALAFVTGPGLPDINEHAQRPILTVFVPTSPAPMTGFVLFVPEDEVIPLRHSVEEVMRVIVSGGVLGPARLADAHAGDGDTSFFSLPAPDGKENAK